MEKKYSIVIPTTKYSLMEKCIDSILANTSKEKLQEIEIIAVVNSDQGYDRILEEFPEARILFTGERIGYTKATNMGISIAAGQFIILMNDDCEILPYKEKDVWLSMLEAPFVDQSVGITGPSRLICHEAKRPFLIFFLVMIRKSLIDEIGKLDEAFNPGGGEDIDFCLKAERAGYKCIKVPVDDDKWEYGTDFPIYHKAEATVFEVPNWEEKFQARMKEIEKRSKQFKYDRFADVTAEISTKGRYTTSLPACIASVANQTLLPKKLILFQDDPQSFDMRASSVYTNLFNLLEKKGIEWNVVFGEGKGQVANHQKAIDLSKTEWIWRLDDDNIAEPDTLEKLTEHCSDAKVGAVGGCVIDPGFIFTGGMMKSSLLKHIGIALNVQWVHTDNKNSTEVDHLYSTFLFRREAAQHGYCKELSPVGHREETIFTYEMKRNGWKLIVDPRAVTWHMRESAGGIRSFNDHRLWEHDEKVFQMKLNEWGVQLSGNIWINLNCGLGDHWVAKPIIEEMVKRDPTEIINVCVCYPEVFEDMRGKINVVSIAEGEATIGKERMEQLNVYAFCMSRNWKRSLTEAFETMFLPALK